MKALTITLTPDMGEAWTSQVKVDLDTMKQAATLAARAGAALGKVRADANILAAGGRFTTSKRFRNAMSVKAYPDKKVAIDPAVQFLNKIPYSQVFESGQTIHGQPILWLPLSTTPTQTGQRRITPKTFESLTGAKLIPFRSPHSGNLMLGVRVKVPKKVASGEKTLTRLSLAKIKRFASGQAKTGVETTFPVFVAIRTVNLRKRFDIEGVANSVADELPGLYLRNMEELVG